jgi:hypothetical protein
MIPATAHFIWIGRSLPWAHVVALRSAAKNGGFDRVVLHHDADLSGTPCWPDVVATPTVETRRLTPGRILARTPYAAELGAVFARLESAAAQSNLLRVALLYGEGGVYLDLDTVTVAPLTSLRASTTFFCGVERLAFPAWLRPRENPARFALGVGQSAARAALRHVPDGWRWFRAIEHWYPTAANNAVLGAAAEHPFTRRLLEAMASLPHDQQRIRFALGTHLLQRELSRWTGADVCVEPPEAFYPLGPEISEHWFRMRSHARLNDVLGDRTRVVHWYASNRTRQSAERITPDFVVRNAERQWFSALARPFIA